MTPRRRYLFAPLVLCAVIFPATAYAKAPSNAHIRFRVPSTLSQPPIPGANDTGDIGGFVYWTAERAERQASPAARTRSRISAFLETEEERPLVTSSRSR